MEKTFAKKAAVPPLLKITEIQKARVGKSAKICWLQNKTEAEHELLFTVKDENIVNRLRKNSPVWYGSLWWNSDFPE